MSVEASSALFLYEEAMARELGALIQSGPRALGAYLRNVRLELFGKARRAFVEVKS